MMKLHASVYGIFLKIMKKILNNSVSKSVLIDIFRKNILSRDGVVEILERCKKFVDVPSSVALSNF